MSSKKIRKNKPKRKHSKRQKRIEDLKQKLEKGPLRGKKVIIEPRGVVKMSDVLKDFVEPYSEFANTIESYHKLLTLGVIAWNTSLLPKQEQQAIVDKTFDEGLPMGSDELKMDIKDIVNMLIERKNTYFSENTRTIVNFQLKDTGSKYHITVISTLSVR